MVFESGNIITTTSTTTTVEVGAFMGSAAVVLMTTPSTTTTSSTAAAHAAWRRRRLGEEAGDTAEAGRGLSQGDVCGDGNRTGAEMGVGRCDDGNTANADGCSDACYVEPGWYCEVDGQPCRAVCGDGAVALPQESCDDGNVVAFDGCSPRCQVEPGRCAVQATTLCTGAYFPRPDVPVTHFCRVLQCTVKECCLPSLGPVPGHLDTPAPVLAYADEFEQWTPALEPWPVPPLPCDYACPMGFLETHATEAVPCEGPRCRLAHCCRAETVACACAPGRRRPQCCAPVLLPPLAIDAGAAGTGRLELNLTSPAIAYVAGAVRWYYYHSGGALRQDVLQQELSPANALILSGYKVRLPPIEDLQALFALRPFYEPDAEAPAEEPTDFWSSSPATNATAGLAWALHREAGATAQAFPAPVGLEKHVLLEVSEAITVVHGRSRLRRQLMQDGMPCCFAEDGSQVRGVPLEMEGATFFLLEDPSDYGVPGTFTVTAAVPVLLYAMWAVDPNDRHAGAFEMYGWDQMATLGFQLQPSGLALNAWRTALSAGDMLEVRHAAGLIGSVAVRPADMGS